MRAPGGRELSSAAARATRRNSHTAFLSHFVERSRCLRECQRGKEACGRADGKGREGARSGTNTANVTRLTRGKGGREGDSRRKGFTPRDPSCCHLQSKLPETELHRVANQIREKVYGIPKFPRPTPWPAASVDVVRDTSSACIGHAPSSQRCCKKRARMRQRSDEARAGRREGERQINDRQSWQAIASAVGGVRVGLLPPRHNSAHIRRRQQRRLKRRRPRVDVEAYLCDM